MNYLLYWWLIPIAFHHIFITILAGCMLSINPCGMDSINSPRSYWWWWPDIAQLGRKLDRGNVSSVYCSHGIRSTKLIFTKLSSLFSKQIITYWWWNAINWKSSGVINNDEDFNKGLNAQESYEISCDYWRPRCS